MEVTRKLENNTYPNSTSAAVPAEKSKAAKIEEEAVPAEKAIGVRDENYNEPDTATENFDVEKEINNKKKEQETLTETKMGELAENMLKYYCSNHGSLIGFKNTGFPSGVTDLKIKTNVGYDNENSDEFNIGEDGTMSVARMPDDLSITLIYKFEGKTYVITTKNVQYPWQSDTGEKGAEIVGYYDGLTEDAEIATPDPANSSFGI